MWKIILTLILIFSLFQGVIIYLSSIMIAKLKLGYETNIDIFKDISPYELSDKYMLDQIFNTPMKKVFARLILYIIGYIGFTICSVIHLIYYYYYKSVKISMDTNVLDNEESSDVDNDITVDNNTTDSYNISKSSKYIENDESKCIIDEEYIKKPKYTIDLIIDRSILNRIDLKCLLSELDEFDIRCNRVSDLVLDKNLEPSISTLNTFKNNNFRELTMYSNSIDSAIFMVNDYQTKKMSEQTICVCWRDEFYEKSLFKHLCAPVSLMDEHLLSSRYYQKMLANKICKLIKY